MAFSKALDIEKIGTPFVETMIDVGEATGAFDDVFAILPTIMAGA